MGNSEPSWPDHIKSELSELEELLKSVEQPVADDTIQRLAELLTSMEQIVNGKATR